MHRTTQPRNPCIVRRRVWLWAQCGHHAPWRCRGTATEPRQHASEVQGGATALLWRACPRHLAKGHRGKGDNRQSNMLRFVPGCTCKHIQNREASSLLQSVFLHTGPSWVQCSPVSLQLRLAGNMEARDGNLKGALQCYSEALELNPPRGQHLLYANRSGVKLALGDAAGAVEDGQQAVEQAPAGFTTAFIRLVRLASVPPGCCALQRCWRYTAGCCADLHLFMHG